MFVLVMFGCSAVDSRMTAVQAVELITSHHMEKMEAGLKGLCIREIVTK